MTFKERVRNFFIPAPGSPRWMWVPSILVVGLLALGLLGGSVHAWEYSNSPEFCGTACHTMPPQSVTYLNSPHANVTCEECHIGRVSLQDQFTRKTREGLRELYLTAFNLYEYPIHASALQPVRDTCEKCHKPEAFAGDTLRTITRFESDADNTSYITYLILKTRGGTKDDNQGHGIHWHIDNQVEYYAVDKLEQIIPYVRVHHEDGTITEYIDIESDFDPASIDESQMQTMDCVSCHNRVSHNFKSPAASMDDYMARHMISSSIPEIRIKAIEMLSNEYETQELALNAIAGLENYYEAYHPEFYKDNAGLIQDAIVQIQNIYKDNVFIEQEVNWETHPNNLGHIEGPGCFRCHDGKHLNELQEGIRLECNLCHSIPVVVSPQDFVANIEISRGPEPESHRNANWISLHNQALNETCSNCHTTADAGGSSNTSFCSNSACHNNVFTYAGFDAPKLREILKDQLVIVETPVPAPQVSSDNATYDSGIKDLLAARCAMCHGDAASAGLNVSSYASLMQGGDKGPVIIAGDPENSSLVQVQLKQHFANFSEEELEIIKTWIADGAPEN